MQHNVMRRRISTDNVSNVSRQKIWYAVSLSSSCAFACLSPSFRYPRYLLIIQGNRINNWSSDSKVDVLPSAKRSSERKKKKERKSWKWARELCLRCSKLSWKLKWKLNGGADVCMRQPLYRKKRQHPTEIANADWYRKIVIMINKCQCSENPG